MGMAKVAHIRGQALDSSPVAAKYLRSIWDMSRFTKQESVYALFLSENFELIGHELISIGSLWSTPMDFRNIVRLVFEYDAKRVVIAHNHPYGRALPSKNDIDVTKRAVEIFKTLDIGFLDHIILSPTEEFSFADKTNLI